MILSFLFFIVNPSGVVDGICLFVMHVEVLQASVAWSLWFSASSPPLCG